MNYGRNGDSACCVRMLLLLFPQPASGCLGTLRGIHQPQPNGTYLKDDFCRFIGFSPLFRGFWFGWTLHLTTVRCIRLISAHRMLPKEWPWFGMILVTDDVRFVFPEILHSYRVVLTILSLTSTTGSPLPFWPRSTSLIHVYPTWGQRFTLGTRLFWQKMLFPLGVAVVAPRFRSFKYLRRQLIKPRKHIG